MPKNKRPAPKRSNPPSPEKDGALAQKLCDLAVELAEREDSESMDDALKQNESELNKLIKRSIYQKKDELLYESLEHAKYADIDAYQLLKSRIEEASEIIVAARGDGKNVEVNAFIIPLFARTVGGLHSEQCFHDQDAFDLLTKSFQEAQLESPTATVVLINYAYHLDEIDSITFSHLNDMVRDAHAAMTDMRRAATSAIDRSIGGWPTSRFAPGDHAVELRFLLGFALKTTDDVFYRLPEGEAAVDAYFDARAECFEQWTERVAPLVKRCLTTDGTEIDVNFLYQDLFHGGKERGVAEYFMLQMMSELNHGLEERGIDPKGAKAVVGPAEIRNNTVLRVNLYAGADDALVASSEKPWSIGRDLEIEIADVHDALKTIGVTSLTIAAKFDADGQPVDVQPAG